jgi:hypothetical protein
MSIYPSPERFTTIFNNADFQTGNTTLTLEEANTLYLRLKGGIMSGLLTCGAGISTSTIFKGANILTVPSKTDTIATLTDIPSLSSYLTASSSPNISGSWLYNQSSLQLKSNNAFYGTCNAPNGLGSNLTYTFPASSGTVALQSDIPSLSLYTKYDSNYDITGNWKHSIGSLQLKSNTSSYGILNAPSGLGSNLTYTFPSSSGTIALTSDIVAPSSLLANDGTETSPSISFTSDPDTGIFKSATNTVSICGGGNKQFSVSNTNRLDIIVNNVTYPYFTDFDILI